jgi:hypothetical protein
LDEGQCPIIEVSFVPILRFQNRLIAPLSNFLVNYDEDVTWGLRNSLGGLVFAKVLTQGIILNYNLRFVKITFFILHQGKM